MHDWRHVVGRGPVDVGAGFHQILDHLKAALLGSVVQRRGARRVRLVAHRAHLEEALDQRRVAACTKQTNERGRCKGG